MLRGVLLLNTVADYYVRAILIRVFLSLHYTLLTVTSEQALLLGHDP